MAYLAYNYSESETFSGIAAAFNTTVQELMRVNNISPPYPNRPSDLDNPSEQILVPDILTGNESVENRKNLLRDNFMQSQGRPVPRDLFLGAYSGVGDNVQHQVYIIISGIGTMYFPCFPESISDSNSANFSELNPIGRSEPFQIYQNSGPREVSVSFTMHKEMVHTTPIEILVNAIKSATYPLGRRSGGSTFNTSVINGVDIVPTVQLVIGNQVDITGVIKGNVSIKWYGPINKANKYNMVDIDFTVTECTGDPKTAESVAFQSGYSGEDWSN